MPGASNAAAIDNANDVVPITLAAGNTSIIGRGIVVLSAGAGTKVLKVKTTSPAALPWSMDRGIRRP
jgi:hypothetical protein